MRPTGKLPVRPFSWPGNHIVVFIPLRGIVRLAAPPLSTSSIGYAQSLLRAYANADQGGSENSRVLVRYTQLSHS